MDGINDTSFLSEARSMIGDVIELTEEAVVGVTVILTFL